MAPLLRISLYAYIHFIALTIASTISTARSCASGKRKSRPDAHPRPAIQPDVLLQRQVCSHLCGRSGVELVL